MKYEVVHTEITMVVEADTPEAAREAADKLISAALATTVNRSGAPRLKSACQGLSH
jgi:hypothetical protein